MEKFLKNSFIKKEFNSMICKHLVIQKQVFSFFLRVFLVNPGFCIKLSIRNDCLDLRYMAKYCFIIYCV